MQIGSSSTSLSVIRSRIHEIIKDPIDCGVIIPGDIEDEDRPSTRIIRAAAFAGRGEVPRRDAQKHMAYIDKEIISLLLPLQKTKYGIIGILAGHHWTQLSPALNSVQYICMELSRLSGKKVQYLGQMLSYLDLYFESRRGKSTMKRGLIVHGEGGGQTKGSTIQKLERLAQGFEGDFFIRGHDCQLLSTKTDKLYPKKQMKNGEPEMMSKTIVYLNLGAATRGYEMNLNEPSYVESALMRPTSMGWGTINFHLRKSYTWEDSDRSMRCVMKVTI